MSANTAQDRWSEWLLHRRFGGDARAAERGMRMLYGVRDRVLDAAGLHDGDTLLDVGAGDGLIAFGALDRVGPHGRVIFTDISQPLLDHARELAEDLGVASRCSFLRAGAEDLTAVDDASVDAVTTRSVLIYVRDKESAFNEFQRVLRPGGRLSVWEPINRFNETYEPKRAFWRDVPGIEDLAARIGSFYRQLQPLDTDPMLDFDERDLLRFAEAAGFSDITVELTLHVSPAEPLPWKLVTNTAGNPNIPTLGEAIERIFTQTERARFESVLRPIVEAGGRMHASAFALVTATKERNAGAHRPREA